MDWRALGYWPVYKDGKKVWEKEEYPSIIEESGLEQ